MALSRHDIVRIGLGEQDRLLAYIFAIVHDDHIAEDVFQETFALAVEKNERINDAEHFVRWLRVTARNKSKEALRTRANSPQLLDDAVIDSLESHWDAIDTEAHTAQIARGRSTSRTYGITRSPRWSMPASAMASRHSMARSETSPMPKPAKRSSAMPS